jgi:hypothetical protein
MQFHLQNRRWGTARQAEATRKELHVRLPAHDCATGLARGPEVYIPEAFLCQSLYQDTHVSMRS